MFLVRIFIENGFIVIKVCNLFKIGSIIFFGCFFVEMLIWIFNKDCVMLFFEIFINRVFCKYLYLLF